MIFQSTPPVRGATEAPAIEASKTYISIHAPRAGSDIISIDNIGDRRISIHAPRAGSDLMNVCDEIDGSISIHAPRAGSDGGYQIIGRT